MLRMYLVQAWFNLSDEGVEDAIYDSYALRKFVGVDFLREQVLDAKTLLHFRHLLEESQLGRAMFKGIKGFTSCLFRLRRASSNDIADRVCRH